MLPRYTQNPMLNNLTNKCIKKKEEEEEQEYSTTNSRSWICILLLFSTALGVSLLLLIIKYSVKN